MVFSQPELRCLGGGLDICPRVGRKDRFRADPVTPSGCQPGGRLITDYSLDQLSHHPAPPPAESAGAWPKAERREALRKSRLSFAMNSWLISFGQTALHS